MRALVVLLFVALLYLAGILMGSSGLIFVDIPSILLVLGACLIPCGVLGREVLLPFRRGLSEQEGRRAGEVLTALDRAAFAGAWLSVLIGGVQTASQVHDPNALGPALVVTVLPLFYAQGLRVFVWRPLEVRWRASRPSEADYLAAS